MTLSIDISKIQKAYSGKDMDCACGCSGTYWYASAHQKSGGVSRGYAVTDEEVSDRQVKRVVNKIVSLVNGGAKLDKVDGVYYAAVEGNRQYIAYIS